jgi:DNA-binding PadR family transcriptional regulator
MVLAKEDVSSASGIAKALNCSSKTIYSRMPVLHKEGWVEMFSGYGKNRKYYRIQPERKKLITELINTIDAIKVQESETEITWQK